MKRRSSGGWPGAARRRGSSQRLSLCDHRQHSKPVSQRYVTCWPAGAATGQYWPRNVLKRRSARRTPHDRTRTPCSRSPCSKTAIVCQRSVTIGWIASMEAPAVIASRAARPAHLVPNMAVAASIIGAALVRVVRVVDAGLVEIRRRTHQRHDRPTGIDLRLQTFVNALGALHGITLPPAPRRAGLRLGGPAPDGTGSCSRTLYAIAYDRRV